MKEKFFGLIEWIKGNETFCELWRNDVIRGAVIGIGITIAAIILARILKLIFCRRKKCTSLTIAGEGGSIVVSISALSGALRYELASLTQLEVRKIIVFQTKKGYVFEICGKFFPHKSSAGAPDLFAEIKRITNEKMQTIFGIENITGIKLKIDACPIEEKNELPAEDLL